MDSELRYKPWGEVRIPANGQNPGPSDYTFTGQYSNMDDFGLMFYNARWYDPALGRFASADTIIPRNGQGLDRYAYANNSPVVYVDSTGHFTVDAIKKYLMGYCGKSNKCYDNTLAKWQADKDWWNMLLTAQAGDVIFGAAGREYSQFDAFMFEFQGEGEDVLSGILPYNEQGSENVSLDDIQVGKTTDNMHGTTLYSWFGIVRDIGKVPSFYMRPGVSREDLTAENYAVTTIGLGGSALSLSVGTLTTLGWSARAAFFFSSGSIVLEKIFSVNDALDMEHGDVSVRGTGPGGYVYYFNFNDSGNGYSLEKYTVPAKIGGAP